MGPGIPPLGPPGGPGAVASQATGCVLVRYGHYRGLHATEAEVASFRAIADAAVRHGLAVMDHLMVVPASQHSSAFLGGS